MVDSAGGRSQLAQLTAAAVVLIVLLLLTGPLAQLPQAALAAVVFLIAAGLIDLRGMRRIAALRTNEFAVALLTTTAVVVLGVEDGVVLAVVFSIIEHLRHSYSPLNSVLQRSPAGHLRPVPVEPGARTEPGLVIYRFGTSLYFANAAKFVDDVRTLAGQGGPLQWMVFDCAAIGDIDYTASTVLSTAVTYLQQRHARVAFSSVLGPVSHQLDRYGVSKALGPGAYYDSPGAVHQAYRATNRASDGTGPNPS
jgi:sulfate permease, SulP family